VAFATAELAARDLSPVHAHHSSRNQGKPPELAKLPASKPGS